MLEISAWFHDIGHLISVHKHDYHTRTLIRGDEAFDFLPDKLRSTLAIIAGGHRKKVCTEIDKLSSKRQELILKLTAILRMADAIDYYRRTDIAITNLYWRKGAVVMVMQGSMLDFVFERIAKKGTLFKELFAPLHPEQELRRL